MPEMDWDSQQHPSAPSTPNSFSSQSTGNSNPGRTEKIPTLKQISPSPSVTALSKLSDEDLRRKGKEDLLMMIRRMEADYKNLLGEHGNVVKDVNRRYQIFVLESRNLKEVNQKLQDDNQELRDLCCFLDDDRQRGRKLAREWQRFGRYTASVMRSEVAVYQEKLRELEQRQSELVTENVELKELCLFLDQERTRITGDRDEGDGSSNGTTTGQEDSIVGHETNGTSITGSSSYLRDLELKVQKLEEEKRLLAQRINRNSAEGHDGSTNDNTLVQDNGLSSGTGEEWLHGSGMINSLSPDDQKPDAVVHAMKVLQVHEELEKVPTHDEKWDDSEKAILREMCNVVWRKLGDVGGGDVGSFNESSESILDPPPPTSTSLAPPGVVAGVHGQTQSFSLQQPQPQMASTPLASVTNTKMSSSSHFTDPPPPSSSSATTNQKLPPESSQSSHLPSPTKPPQSSRQPEYLNQNQQARKSSWPPQADQRVDMYLGGNKDQVITADARPISPMKKQEMDRILHDDYDRVLPSTRPSHPLYPAHSKPYQYPTPEDEKIPPHFLPHRRQGPPPQYSNLQQYTTQPPPSSSQQQRQPQPQSGPPTKPPQLQHPHSQIKPTTPSQYHHPSRNASSSSSLPSTNLHPTNTATAYSNNNNITDPSSQNQHLLTSSQQYPPHHSIRLLDAPGVHQQPQQPPNTKPISDYRPMSKDDNYSSQKPQKPISSSSHHPQMMYQRRDDIRSEPNISQSGTGRHIGSRGGPVESQPARGPSRAGMERQPESYSTNQHPHPHHQPHHHGRFASESSQGYQSMSSIPSSRPSNPPFHPDQLPTSHHGGVSGGGGGGGGFSAYPPTSAAKPQHHQQYTQGSRPSSNQQQVSMQKTPVMGRAGQPRWNGAVPGGGGKQLPGRNPPSRNHYDDYDSDSL